MFKCTLTLNNLKGLSASHRRGNIEPSLVLPVLLLKVSEVNQSVLSEQTMDVLQKRRKRRGKKMLPSTQQNCIENNKNLDEHKILNKYFNFHFQVLKLKNIV